MGMRYLAPLCIHFLLCLAVGAAPLCLEFEANRIVTPADGPAKEEGVASLRVVLGQTYLEFQQGDELTMIDFAAGVTHHKDGAEYSRASIYADVGFRVAEAANRWVLNQALSQAKIDEAAADMGDVVTVEHLFSIDDKKTDANLSISEGETITYKHKGKLLAELSSKGQTLTAQQSLELARFLRYYLGGHADILRDIEARGVVPTDIRVDVSSLGSNISYRLHLVKAQECQVTTPDFSSLTPVAIKDETLAGPLSVAEGLTPEQAESSALEILAKADAALARKAPLEAALSIFEAYLMRGGELPSQMSNSKAVFQADPDCLLMFEALGTGNEQPEKAVANLRSLEAKVPNPQVLKIFQAGFLLPQGEIVKAREQYLAALTLNPGIVGAWKDLGDIYYSNYETGLAWRCWDLARRLAPEHDMVGEIEKREKALRTGYPEYF